VKWPNLSPFGDYITGANLVIDGRMSLLGFTNFELLLPNYYKGSAKARRNQVNEEVHER
jgi:hypothetical protein